MVQISRAASVSSCPSLSFVNLRIHDLGFMKKHKMLEHLRTKDGLQHGRESAGFTGASAENGGISWLELFSFSLEVLYAVRDPWRFI